LSPKSRFLPVLTLVIGLAVGAGGLALLHGHGALNSATSAGAMMGGNDNQASGAMSAGAGMMGAGAGMMGAGSDIAGGAPGGLVPATRMEALAAQAAQAVRRNGSVLSYANQQVTIVALAAPGNRPGMYWQLDGADGPNGPTISIPAHSQITVDFADGDPGHPHGFELTTAAPPYPRMAMMSGQLGSGGAFIMPVPAPKSNLWYAATVEFQAPSPGTYYIICPVPGHAQQGMWAKLIVR